MDNKNVKNNNSNKARSAGRTSVTSFEKIRGQRVPISTQSKTSLHESFKSAETGTPQTDTRSDVRRNNVNYIYNNTPTNGSTLYRSNSSNTSTENKGSSYVLQNIKQSSISQLNDRSDVRRSTVNNVQNGTTFHGTAPQQSKSSNITTERKNSSHVLQNNRQSSIPQTNTRSDIHRSTFNNVQGGVQSKKHPLYRSDSSFQNIRSDVGQHSLYGTQKTLSNKKRNNYRNLERSVNGANKTPAQRRFVSSGRNVAYPSSGNTSRKYNKSANSLYGNRKTSVEKASSAGIRNRKYSGRSVPYTKSKPIVDRTKSADSSKINRLPNQVNARPVSISDKTNSPQDKSNIGKRRDPIAVHSQAVNRLERLQCI